MNLPVGSGQVESAVRRVVNLRFKAPGCFWKENTVNNLLHLRACFKAGRWDELMKRVLATKFYAPHFQSGKRYKPCSREPLTGPSFPNHTRADDYQLESQAA